MKLGYCPTMKEFAHSFAEKNSFEAINLGSAANVLLALNNNEIDVGIIGRKAKKAEFDGYEKRIKDGYTLITLQKSMIRNEDLVNLEIHTDLPKDIVEKIYPELQNIVYENSLTNAIQKGNVQLINWEQWNDKFSLLIPVDDFNNKNPKFRVPHLYSKQEGLIKN